MAQHHLSLACLFLVSCGQADFKNGTAPSPVTLATPTAQAEPPSEDAVAEVTPATPTPTAATSPGSETTPVPGVPGVQLLSGTEDFSSKIDRPKVDVVWLIDNSSSMTEEAAHVRKNFSEFLAKTQARVDLRIILVSEKYNAASTGIGLRGVSLPPEALALGHVQIPLAVGSTNALTLGAAGSCDGSASDLDQNKICGLSVSSIDVEDEAGVQWIRGRLVKYFRPDAERAFVVVTDDGASGITHSNFVKATQPYNNNKSPFAFAFRGIKGRIDPATGKPDPTCMVDDPDNGVYYEKLANQTGGAAYDICDKDWSANFATLSDKIASLKETNYKIAQANVVSIESVRIDGTAVPASKYRFEKGTLTLAAGVVAKDGQSVKINYVFESSH